MSGQVDELFEESIELVQRYGKCLAKDVNCDIYTEFTKLSPIMMDICDARKRYLAVQNVFKDYTGEIDDSEEIDSQFMVDSFKTAVEKTISKLPLGATNEVYVEFKDSLLCERNPLDDSDIATVSEARTTIDPITKLPLTDPVKNIKCGHVYEKSIILQLLKGRKIVKCPIAGCIAADCVDKDDLVPDIALKRYLDSTKKS